MDIYYRNGGNGKESFEHDMIAMSVQELKHTEKGVIMKIYDFNGLAEELEIGREIEFEYNNKQYSITNSIDGYWYLYCDTTKTELLKICKFEDKENLIKIVSEYEIDEISIQQIFDSFKYNQETLCIL